LLASYSHGIGNAKGRNHLGDLDVDRIILKRILEREDLRVWTGFTWLRIGSIGRFVKMVTNLWVP
jgi:hypothetical protein